MTPEKVYERAVRIGPFVGMLMMHPMGGDPANARALQIAQPEQSQPALQPCGTGKAAMCQQAMKAEIDPKRTKCVEPD